MKPNNRFLLAAFLGGFLATSLPHIGMAQTCARKACNTAKGKTSCPHCRKASELKRAGYPNQVSKLAIFSNGPGYAGYYVGGSTPFSRKGCPRSEGQGVWGWDYWGKHFKRHIALRWLNGGDAKRKFGQYETDGPKLAEKLHLHRE